MAIRSVRASVRWLAAVACAVGVIAAEVAWDSPSAGAAVSNWDFDGHTSIPDASVSGPTGAASVTFSVSGLPSFVHDVNLTFGHVGIYDCTSTTQTQNRGLNHPRLVELSAVLAAPNGAEVTLFDQNVSGSAFCDTTFDDEATSGISGATPFIGSFRPSSPLSGLDGVDPNGTWTLTVVDHVNASAGFINAVRLAIDSAATAPTTATSTTTSSTTSTTTSTTTTTLHSTTTTTTRRTTTTRVRRTTTTTIRPTTTTTLPAGLPAADLRAMACESEVVPTGYKPLYGTSGNDHLMGTSGQDIIFGRGGDDTISGASGNDILCGGDGDDRLDGGTGSDVLVGGDGSGDLRGGSGADYLYGGIASDRFDGGSGRDVARSGGGVDSYFGVETKLS